MKLLLDTHALLWWVFEPHRLPPAVYLAIASPDNQVWVSAATIMEIATKHRIGKLDYAEAIVRDFQKTIELNGFRPLPISLDHAALAGTIVVENKDPFDRFLLAQAIFESFTIVSNEAVFDTTTVARLWK